MAQDQKASVQNITDLADDIPTLSDIRHEPDNAEMKLEAMVSHLAEELQASLHQHLYQAMVKTLHQVVNDESQKLSLKILEKLHEQLPTIIETACKQSPKK